MTSGDDRQNSIANMEGLQAAIANGESQRVSELLSGQCLDELQRSYLVDLARLSNDPDIVELLKSTPIKKPR